MANIVGSELRCRVKKRYEQKKIFIIRKPSQELNDFTDTYGFERKTFQEMNEKLMKMCGHFYNIQSSTFDMSINETLKAITKENNVINLWVRDYYDNTSDVHHHKRLVYAGDVVYQPILFDDRPESDACSNSKDQESEKRIAKIVSKSVANINSGDFVDFISSIQYENNTVTSRRSCLKQANKTTDLTIVLVCSDKWKNCLNKNWFVAKNLKFKFQSTNTCGEFTKIYQNNILAVLAPTPFEMEYEVTIPTIFYETPYMSSEHKTLFPNSMNLISGLLLKHVFMKFINKAGWRRVAIISDETPYSFDFEVEMLDLFHGNQILYNVQRCKNADDFEKAKRYLVAVDARIIIANVNETNARELTSILDPYKSRFIILFRVLPFWDWIDYKFQNWISITMGPSEIDYKTCQVERDPICIAIMLSLGIVANTHAEYSLTPEDLHRTTFYRKFAKTMATKIPPESVAYLKRRHEELSKLYLTKNGEISKEVTYSAPFNAEVLDQKECIAKVNNFARPCDYSVYLYLMLVVIMFAITLLTITCYFHESSPLISNSYQQL
ncbi:unnamed protein product [Arctia plantaginis]|uniref:Receptor ligand binding region domain-containing protein n=1 Tax=Arctia plantaginis TaxID=874455 RepID=A0A8S1A548_ARCPL|nr:unnamed protein product [Arctia plantaginis]